MKGLSRATALKIAAVLSVLLGIYNITSNLPMIAQGAAWAAQAPNARPPFAALIIGLMTGVLFIVGAYGAWNQQRWGVILILVVSLPNALMSLAGILFSLVPSFRIEGIVTMVVIILMVVLCLWRERKLVAA